MQKKISIVVLFIIIVVTGLSTCLLKDLKFNYDFESYFPKGDEDFKYFIKYRKQFENDSDFLVIGIENKKGVFDPQFIQKLDCLTTELSTVKDIRKVTSLSNLKSPVISPFGIIEVPYIHPKQIKKLKKDSIRVFKNKNLVGNIISQDGKAALILVNNTLNIKKNAGDSLLANIESLIPKYKFDQVHVAGKIKASKVYIEKMQTELIIFISASTVLISFFLFIAYRAAWGVIVPLLTVIIALIWTLGIMKICGKDLDLLTSLLPPILFVVAMSDMTHLLSKYIEELRNGLKKVPALNKALKEVGITTFITAITTAIGFVTLLNSSIDPIKDFGFYTAIGVFVAYFLAFTFLPSVLYLLPEPTISQKPTESIFWYKKLHSSLRWILRNKFFILNGAITTVILSIFFITQIQVNSKLLDDISDRDPLKQSVLFLEKNFSGVRPFEMAFNVKDTTLNIFSYKVIKEMDSIETFLEKKYGVKNIISPCVIIRTANQAFNGGNPEFYHVPEEGEYLKITKKISQYKKLKEFKSVMSEDAKSARISGKLGDWGSIFIAQKNGDLSNYISVKRDTSLFAYKLTGSALLVDKNNYYLAQSLIEDLIVGIISIALIIGLLFKSLRMVVIALIPNVLPLMIIGGIMGLCGIDLKASTSIIFSIAFGIAVDDSIHFLSRFKLEMMSGKPILYAIKRTYISTGKAMVVTSLIIISGFATLILSTFEGTFYTGLLIGLTLFSALIADLLLMPVLLILFYKKQKQSKY